MIIFKGNHSECPIVPPFPAGDGGIKSSKGGVKTFHPGIGAFNQEHFLIKFNLEKIIIGRFSITGIKTDVCDDFKTLQHMPEEPDIKSGDAIAL